MKAIIQDKKYWGSPSGLHGALGHPNKLCRPSREWSEPEHKHGGCFEGSRHLAYTKEQPPGFNTLSSGSEEEDDDDDDDDVGEGKWDLPCMSSWGATGGRSDPTRDKATKGKLAQSGGRAWPFEVGAGSNSRGRPQLPGNSRRRCFRRRRQRGMRISRTLLYSKSSSLAFHCKLWGKMTSKGRRRGGPKRARSSLSLSPVSQPDDDHLPLYKKSCTLGEDDCQEGPKLRPCPARFKPRPSEPHLDYELDGAFHPSAPQTPRLSLLGALMDDAAPYPQYVELQRVSFDKDPEAMEMEEEATALLKYPPTGLGGGQASPRMRRIGEVEHSLDGDGGNFPTILLASYYMA